MLTNPSIMMPLRSVMSVHGQWPLAGTGVSRKLYYLTLSHTGREHNKPQRIKKKAANQPRTQTWVWRCVNITRHNKVISTLFQWVYWVGTQHNPFVLGDSNSCNALLTIGRAVCSDLNFGFNDEHWWQGKYIHGKHQCYTRSDVFQTVSSYF